MRALQCVELGTVEKLQLNEIPALQAREGEVVIDVHAASLNFPDTLMIEGKYQEKPDLPFIPGAEAAGIVAAVGKDVREFSVGDRVVSTDCLYGAMAEQIALPKKMVKKIPAGLNFIDAASVPITYSTAYNALKQQGKLKTGETLLVLGASGGVGVAAIQIGKAMGATVIAAASSEEKLAFAQDNGASILINYNDVDLKKTLKEVTKNKGVDVIFDPVGGDYSEQAFRAIAYGGRHLVVGFAAGTIPKIPLNLPLLKVASIVGVLSSSFEHMEPEASERNYVEIFSLIEKGKLKPQVTDLFPLEDFEAAFTCLTDRKAKGKVVLKVR